MKHLIMAIAVLGFGASLSGCIAGQVIKGKHQGGGFVYSDV